MASDTTAAPAATQPEAIGLREMLSDPDQRLDQCPARMARANQAARALAGVQAAPAAQEAEPAAQDQYLCQAWGETDLPVAAIVHGLAGVRAFLVAQWLGSEDAEADDGTRMLPAAMDDMQDNWKLEGKAWKWSAEFEIGGISVQKVCAAAAPQAPAAPTQEAEDAARWRYALKGLRYADFKDGTYVNVIDWPDDQAEQEITREIDAARARQEVRAGGKV